MMFQPVEHAVNRRGDVAVFVDAFDERPTGWWADDKGVWIVVPGRLDFAVSLQPSALAGLRERDRLLVVEVGPETNEETWVSRAAD